MSFDFELDGVADLQESIDDLKDDYGESPVYVVTSGAEYSVFLEFGTRDMPPYPFFRPAIKEFEANPEAFLLKNSDLSSIDDIGSTGELVKSVAQALEKQMTLNATAESGGRSPGTHPDHPQVQSTNLRSKIQAQRIG